MPFLANPKHTKESGAFILIGVLGIAVLGGLLGFGKVREFVIGGGIDLGTGIVKIVFATLATASQYIFDAISGSLQWVINNILAIPVAPNNPAVIPIVRIGWEVSRDLVNTAFLLILVFIGLAMILRLREYANQKIFINLVLIALLVNFSGVLVGLVVDIGNIITNFFFLAVANVEWTVFWPGQDTTSGSDLPEIVALSIGIMVYYAVASLIYLAIIWLLFLRLFILWVLAITAPLAFAAYILPATRKFWNQWWSTLIQWTFIGVPIGFFMYLAGTALDYGADDILGRAVVTATDPSGVAFLGPVVVLFLLFTGVTLSLTLAPAGTRGILRFGRTAAAVTVGVLARDLIRAGLTKSGRVQRMAQRMETYSSRDRGVFGQTVGRVSAPFVRRAGRAMGSGNVDAMAGETRKSETEVQNLATGSIVSRIKGNISTQKKAGYLNAIVKRGDIDEARRAGLTDPEIKNIRFSAQKFGAHRDIDTAMPHLTTKADVVKELATRLGRTPTPAEETRAYDDRFRTMRPDRVQQISEGVFEKDSTGAFLHPETLEQMLGNWDGRHMGNFNEKHGSRGIEAMEQRIDELVAAGPYFGRRDWLEQENPRLLKYIESDAGQRLGFDLT